MKEINLDNQNLSSLNLFPKSKKFRSISFYNNSFTEVPSFVWKQKKLEIF